ncbi:MAG: Na+:solute symporter [Cryomorphaceae bacterium]|nr:Na+:solute symporter [Cryomorphaceae bacterium]
MHPVDWIIIVLSLALFVGINLYLRNSGSKNMRSFFLGGGKMPWYVLGLSMVATTFAADTPLWVTEKIAQHGISGNWLWWNMMMGGMLTTFFFAKLWKRADILTEPEFIELRYSGKGARWLRGFKAVYLGLFLNAVIMGWVNLAMMRILEVFFDLDQNTAFWLTMAGLILVALYASLAGLSGIVITDSIQFFIAMIGSIALAIIALRQPEIGGIAGLKDQLPEWRFDFFPKIGEPGGVGTFSLSIGAFLSYFLLQWWNSWYPGAEPGGGGYIAQRMMSARSEKEALWSVLFFQILHYAFRPWPWIIVGLCALVFYPNLPIEMSGKGFVMVMKDYLPVGLKGLLLVAFISAYMSTISTQINWGASYLINDLYARFIRRPDRFSGQAIAETHYVRMGKLTSILLIVAAGFVTSSIHSIDQAAQFLIACGAGLGSVLILRWYWWRINAWSEIAATIIPIPLLFLAEYVLTPLLGSGYTDQNGVFYTVVGCTIVGWLLVTFLTRPTDAQTLTHYVGKVRPGGIWGAYAISTSEKLRPLFLQWIFAVVMGYGSLFAVGYGIFQEWQWAMIWGIAAVVGGVGLVKLTMNNC